MTGIKFCGLKNPSDIEAANSLEPEYVGFVFAPKSRRFVTPEEACELKRLLSPKIQAVGVFVDERPEVIAELLTYGVIDMAQLHGTESPEDIRRLKEISGKPVITAFRIKTAEDVRKAMQSPADYVLLDSGMGTGTVFDWEMIKGMERPYFLAGGLEPGNVGQAIRRLSPFAVDVSSGIETDGVKDLRKMAEFSAAVRKEERV